MNAVIPVDNREIEVEIRSSDAALLARLSGAHPLSATLALLIEAGREPVCEALAARVRSALGAGGVAPPPAAAPTTPPEPQMSLPLSGPAAERTGPALTAGPFRPATPPETRLLDRVPTRLPVGTREARLDRPIRLSDLRCVEGSLDEVLVEAEGLEGVLNRLLLVAAERVPDLPFLGRICGLRPITGKVRRNGGGPIGTTFLPPNTVQGGLGLFQLAKHLGVSASLGWRPPRGRPGETVLLTWRPEAKPDAPEQVRTVRVGDHITVLRVGGTEEQVYQIIPATEPNDPVRRRINAAQPFARAVLGCAIDQTFSVEAAGERRDFILRDIA